MPDQTLIRFVTLGRATLAALIDKNLDEASLEAGVALTPHFITDEALRRWRRRLGQIATGLGDRRADT